jgi:LysR family transcriptional regulator, carnitine catabolism transcriptional activator
MQMDLSIRHLKAFLALAEKKSFTRAAEACFLSQPAFSMLIRSLEQGMGLRLFDRGTRHVELTAEGRAFELSAARLLAEFDGVLSEIKDLAALRKGRLTIAALPSLSARHLPPVIAEFGLAHPQLELVLHDVTADDCLDLVRRGRADIALTAAAESGEFDIEPAWPDSFFLVCPQDHALARRKRVQSADLLGHTFVQQDRSSSIRQQVDAVMFPQRLKTVMEVSSMATAAGLVASGVGIAIVPAVAMFYFDRPNLVRIPLSDPAFTRHICIVRQKGRQDTLAAAAFLSLLRQRWTA